MLYGKGQDPELGKSKEVLTHTFKPLSEVNGFSQLSDYRPSGWRSGGVPAGTAGGVGQGTAKGFFKPIGISSQPLFQKQGQGVVTIWSGGVRSKAGAVSGKFPAGGLYDSNLSGLSGWKPFKKPFKGVKPFKAMAKVFTAPAAILVATANRKTAQKMFGLSKGEARTYGTIGKVGLAVGAAYVAAPLVYKGASSLFSSSAVAPTALKTAGVTAGTTMGSAPVAGGVGFLSKAAGTLVSGTAALLPAYVMLQAQAKQQQPQTQTEFAPTSTTILTPQPEQYSAGYGSGGSGYSAGEQASLTAAPGLMESIFPYLTSINILIGSGLILTGILLFKRRKQARARA